MPRRILHHCALSLILSLLACVSVQGQSTLPVPLPEEIFPRLKEILKEALRQSPAMVQKNLEVAQAEATRYMNRSPLLPSVNSSVSYSLNTSSPSEASGVKSKSDGIFYNVSVYQPIFQWGTLKAQADSSRIGVSIAKKDYAEAYRNLALSIRSQFLALVVKKIRLQNADYGLKMATEALAVNEQRLKNGVISEGAIIPYRLAVSDAGLARDQALEDFDYSREYLKQTAGLSSLTSEDIPSEVPRKSLEVDGGVLAQQMTKFESVGVEETNIAQSYIGRIRQAELAYKIQKYRLFPKLGFGASVSQSNSTYATPTSVTQAGVYSESLNLTVTWSIFDGFATKGAKMGALANKRSSERSLKTYLDTTRAQAKNMEKQMMFAFRAMQIANMRRDLAQAGVTTAKEDMSRGYGAQSNIDSNTAAFNSATLTANASRADFLNRATELLSLIGEDPALENLPPTYNVSIK